MCRSHSDNNAVSETLGYILIFMIVVSCIAIILVIGNGVLDNAKSQNNFKGIEQGFMVVSSDLKQVALEGTPLKTTRIHMEGGSITANSSTNEIKVTYNGNTYNNKIGNITFRSSTSSGIIAIENGGLWEKYDITGSDIMVLKPRIFNISDTNTLVLNIIRLNTTGSSIGGSATVSITLQDQGTNVYPYSAPSPSDAEITLNTAYPQAWARFMEDNGAYISGLDDHSFTAKFTKISKLIIIEHNVGVTLN